MVEILVRWSGEIDLATIADERAAIDLALSDPVTSKVALDLSQVTFFGSTALDAIVELADRAESRGVGFDVRDVPDRVRKVFTITDTLNLLARSPQREPDERR